MFNEYIWKINKNYIQQRASATFGYAPARKTLAAIL